MAIKGIVSLAQVLALTTIMSISLGLAAEENEKVRADSLSVQAEKIKQEVEQDQLQKARDAAKQRAEREKKVLERQEFGDWESEQREKAQKQFNKRESREEKYLREAREAASKDRQIPKPFE
ncbi:hypothetical protein [Shewanella sp. MBTL60-112-B2]|uniref:hypothetical protein n=1 Tax=unclassified Shewanella TaxID=196818 RepID=UPI001BC50586|nr:hypothetical protein TUM4444_39310 [Shewanella sp. MBTL60-112-B1]GIU40078.1 hypothetical protein TUM4445_38450 [Shewanella sp. MBTL60-112-B2]